MSNIVCENCGSPNVTPGRNQIVDDEGNITEEEVECTDCHNIWTVKYRGMADRDILLSQTTRPLLFCATHQLENFVKDGYRTDEATAELEARRTPRAPDEATGCAHRAVRPAGSDRVICDDCGKTLRR